MRITIDVASVLPAVSLREPDDFAGLKVVVTPAEHSYIRAEQLARLGGGQAAAPDSPRVALEGVSAYADAHGWVRGNGAVRARLES